LNEIKTSKDSPLINSAFQFALIEYCKPYTRSDGRALDSNGKEAKYKLGTNYIPPDCLSLHKRILNARNKIHAHKDLTLMEARVILSKTHEGQAASIFQNFIHGSEELRNIDSIIDLIHRTLVKMNPEAYRLESLLEVHD
jgi:hypothetical protein